MELNVANPVSELIDFGRDIIDKIWPDKTAQAAERAQAESHVLDLAHQRYESVLQASVASDTAQAEVNKVEASSEKWWKAGWRPYIGWVCGTALATYYIPYCLVAVVVWAHQAWVTQALPPRPDLGVTDLIALLGSLLGLGTLRTIDKFKGVS
jgi:hypothetical protein